MATKTLKITKLTLQNIKRVKAVQITPDGSLVKITGKNAQGKTTVIDAIAMALGGKTAIPSEPLRRGSKEGEIVVELDNLIIRRTFTDEGKTALQVTDRDGVPQSGPQTLLDSLVGRLAFDPIQFAKMDAKAQGETLRKLTGLDFEDLERRRAKAYAERTTVNRMLDTAKAELRGLAAPEPGLPEQALSVAELLAMRNRRAQERADNAQKRILLEGERRHLQEIRQEIARLEAALESMRAKEKSVAADFEAQREFVAKLQDPDLDSVDAQIRDADGINQKVRTRDAWNAADAKVKQYADQAKALTTEIDNVDAEKHQRIAAASMPVEGLGFGAEGGVTLNGLPFEQASQAEKLKVSMSIGMAMNPTLRVVLIRDGNDLDSDNLAMVARMAEAAGCQCWLERVTDGPGDGWYIEDGMSAAPKAGAAS